MFKLSLLSIAVLVFNIPFGYWRANVKRFRLQWFLAIHIPVLFIIGLRIISDVGFAWHTYLFFVSAYFLGQQAGQFIRRKMQVKYPELSSCLVMDVIRN